MRCPKCDSEFLSTGTLKNLVGRNTCPECATIIHISEEDRAEDMALRPRLSGRDPQPPLAGSGAVTPIGGMSPVPPAHAAPPLPPGAASGSPARTSSAADLVFDAMNLELPASSTGEHRLKLKALSGPKAQGIGSPPMGEARRDDAGTGGPSGSGQPALRLAATARGSGTGPQPAFRPGGTGPQAVFNPPSGGAGSLAVVDGTEEAPFDEGPAPPPRRAANVTLARSGGPGFVLELLGRRTVQIGMTVALGALVAAVLVHALFFRGGASGGGEAAAAGAAIFTAPVVAASALLRATKAAEAGDSETALEAYEAALRAEPGLADAAREAGLLRAALGDTDLARLLLRRYLELRPEAADRAAVEGALDRLDE